MDKTTGKRTWLRRAGALCGAAVVMAGIAACASPGGSVAAGGQPSVRPSATPSKTPGTAVKALPKASCGSALTHGLNSQTQLLRSDPGALTCFHGAAKTCKTAGLAVTAMGVDTGTNNVITIERTGSGCEVTLWHQAYSANGGGFKGKVATTTCKLSTVTGGGVTLSCAGVKVLIPAKVG
jgi:hypothetical protein